MSLVIRHRPTDDRGLDEVLAGEYALPDDFRVGPSPMVLDVGANVGAYALYVLHQWPGAKVYCYEPHPESFALLEKNVAGLGDVTLTKAAVWLADGKAPLYAPLPGLPLGNSSLKNTWEVDLSKGGIAKIIHARHLPPCDILKLDTEGCELDILKAYPHVRSCKAVVLEWHSQEDRVAIRQLLTSLGYDPIEDKEWSWKAGGRGVQKWVRATEPAHLFVSILSGGGKSWDEHVACLSALERLSTQCGINLTIARNSSTGVDRARNMALECALAYEPTVTHFMFIDNDIVFDPQWVVNMVKSGLDVVAGAYPRKDIDWKMVEEAVKSGIGADRLAEYSTSFIINHPVDNDGGDNARSIENLGEFLEVEEIGTGFMMWRREAIDKMLAAYKTEMGYISDYPPRDAIHHMFFSCQRDPACELERAKSRLLKTALVGDPDQVQLAVDMYKDAVKKGPAALGRYLTEDYAACRLWRMIGGKVYLYLNASVGHLGAHKYTGKVSNFFKRQPAQPNQEVNTEQLPGPA